MTHLLTLVSILILLSTTPMFGAEMTFIIDDPGNRNVAQFVSKAPIENVVGTTNQVTGFVTFDPADLSKPVTAKVTVDLRTVDTGIKLRNEHMNSPDYLHTEMHPLAVCELNALIKAPSKQLQEGESIAVTINGRITIHGVTREVTVTGKASYFKENPDLAKMGYPGDMFNFDGQFTVKLADFNIKRPQFLIMKLAEEQHININFTATTGREASK